jgi:DNA end-binding protein Ku
MWKGVLRLGEPSVAVKLYAAVEDTAVHFHLLHDLDGVRVQQRLVNPETGGVVAADRVRKGYALEPGTFVLLEPEEVTRLAPKASRDIEVTTFVPLDAIAPPWFARPYHLGPDASATQYRALAAALEREQCQGIARWVMRGQVYAGALRARDGSLSLIVLRDRESVLSAPTLEPVATREATTQELALAKQLVSSLHGELDLSVFHDEQLGRVRELIEQKAEGKVVKLPRGKPRKHAPESLSAALRASLEKGRVKGPSKARDRAARRTSDKERRSA